MDENFMLKSPTARTLYHTWAEELPIIDYHCHLDPRELAEDRRYENLAQLWLSGDHYKWRAMRFCGVREELITGQGEDWERFLAWARVVPQLVGNPLYHWTHLELKRYFGCEKVLCEATAKEIWEQCNQVIGQSDFSARQLVSRSGVKVLCTTDDPAEDLRYHRILEEDPGFAVKVLPAMRPDRLLKIDRSDFPDYVGLLSRVSAVEIHSFAQLCRAAGQRISFFAAHGCRTCDHGLDSVPFHLSSPERVEGIFQKAMEGQKIREEEAAAYRTAMLFYLMKEYRLRGWVMQLHLGALRSPNEKAERELGPDTGFDSMGGENHVPQLARLLSRAESEDILPKTILYSLNPADNAPLAVLSGAFQGKGVRGRVQQGAAWWFNDYSGGIRRHLQELAGLTALGSFVGMVTDSRSLLSYTRHEYFRRILCDELGRLVEDGEYPWDEATLQSLIESICWKNAADFFGFPLDYH